MLIPRYKFSFHFQAKKVLTMCITEIWKEQRSIWDKVILTPPPREGHWRQVSGFLCSFRPDWGSSAEFWTLNVKKINISAYVYKLSVNRIEFVHNASLCVCMRVYLTILLLLDCYNTLFFFYFKNGSMVSFSYCLKIDSLKSNYV